MKKRVMYLLIALMLIVVLSACKTKTKLEDIKDEKDLFVKSIYDKPSGPFEYFEYTIVYFSCGIENRPYQDYVEILWDKGNFESESWNYDNYFKLQHQPLISLVYKSK